MKIDPRSDKVALHYTGSEAGEPSVSGVPARDLTHNDIDRIVYVQHGNVRGAARQAAVDKLVDDLAAGPYRKTAPAAAAKPRAAKSKTATVPRGTTPPAPPASPPAEPSADSAEGEPR